MIVTPRVYLKPLQSKTPTPMTRRAITLAIAAAVLLLHGGAAVVGFATEKNNKALHVHFQGLVDTRAHALPYAAPLPFAAAGPVLHVDVALASRKPTVQKAFFEAMLSDEATFRATAPSGYRFPYVLCGPQASAKAARREISEASGPSHRTQVVYSSRSLDVACWKGYLQALDAAALEASASFFHVAPVPKVAKLAPGLVQRRELSKDGGGPPVERLTIHPLAFSQGITVFFDPSASRDARVVASRIWNETFYGLASGSAAGKSFVPSAWTKSADDTAPWATVNAAEVDCSSVLAVNVENTFEGLGVLQLKFETLAGEETSDGCLIVALLHLASSSEVAGLEITKKMRLQGHPEKIEATPKPRLRSAKGRELDGSASGVGVLNYVAVTALQSGDSSKPYPFWGVGINGSDQYVQVTDTGFDDASCFLRDTDASKSVLKGPFNFDVQLARSTYDSPITDTSRRKIVQYIEVSSSDDTYKYDYVDGHGTHVAGTVAGRLASDGNNVEVKNYYSDCSDYSGSCSSLFCATCTYSNYCDGMCGFLDNEDFSGMAPSAKIMVSDCIFGVDFILFLSHTNNVLQGV